VTNELSTFRLSHVARHAVTAVARGLGPGLVVVTLMGSCAALQPCAGGIFADTPRQGTVDPGLSPTVRRLRRVEVDFGRVFPGGAPPSAAHVANSLTLNLFPDVCVTAAREQATDLAPGKVQWIGLVTPNGKAILIIDERLMVGTVTIGREVFQIGYLGDGVQAVLDIEQSAFPRD